MTSCLGFVTFIDGSKRFHSRIIHRAVDGVGWLALSSYKQSCCHQRNTTRLRFISPEQIVRSLSPVLTSMCRLRVLLPVDSGHSVGSVVKWPQTAVNRHISSFWHSSFFMRSEHISLPFAHITEPLTLSPAQVSSLDWFQDQEPLRSVGNDA